MTKTYCDCCGMGIPEGHMMKFEWFYLKKGTDEEWITEERDLCRNCGNQLLKDAAKWLKKREGENGRL